MGPTQSAESLNRTEIWIGQPPPSLLDGLWAETRVCCLRSQTPTEDEPISPQTWTRTCLIDAAGSPAGQLLLFNFSVFTRMRANSLSWIFCLSTHVYLLLVLFLWESRPVHLPPCLQYPFHFLAFLVAMANLHLHVRSRKPCSLAPVVSKNLAMVCVCSSEWARWGKWLGSEWFLISDNRCSQRECFLWIGILLITWNTNPKVARGAFIWTRSAFAGRDSR